MSRVLRVFIVVVYVMVLFVPAAYAQEDGKCTTVHNGPIGIFIDPTDEEREAMKKKYSAEDMETIYDDSMWYDYEANKFLHKLGIPTCSTTEDRHEFAAKDGKKFSLDAKCSYWCLIIWNGKEEPMLIDSIDIDLYEDYLRVGIENGGD